jgi:predicted transcriptional regulator
MDDQQKSNPFVSVHTPMALVALALSMFFFSNIMGASQAKDNMRWQSDNAKKQIDTLNQNLIALNKILEDQSKNTPVAKQTQEQFSDFMKDVLELASGEKGDKDAMAVLETAARIGVRVNAPPAEQPKNEAPKKDEKKDK